jgi:hypothetical protein
MKLEVSFDVSAVVVVQTMVFWVGTLFSLVVGYQHFVETHCLLLLQGSSSCLPKLAAASPSPLLWL